MASWPGSTMGAVAHNLVEGDTAFGSWVWSSSLRFRDNRGIMKCSRVLVFPVLLATLLLAACRPTPPGPGKVGQKIDYDGYAITVVSAEFAPDFPGARRARDGFVLVALDVIVESNRARDVTFRPKYAKLVDRDGDEHNARASGREPAIIEYEDLPKGQSRRGWLTYEVAQGARAFQFVYELPPALNSALLKVDITR